jgi:hypothetical protein
MIAICVVTLGESEWIKGKSVLHLWPVDLRATTRPVVTGVDRSRRQGHYLHGLELVRQGNDWR